MSIETDAKELVRVKGITKRFPGVTALRDVDFELQKKEVHVLFGENGAGKSTLIKILAGVYLPDEGTIYIEGEKASIENPNHARSLGIAACYQEFSLVPQLSVVGNLFLGRERRKGPFLDKKGMLRNAQMHLQKLGMSLDINLETKVSALPMATRQITEIVKALIQDVRVLILDEPSTALNEEELASLFAMIQKLKERGIGIIYISHRMEEIKEVCDRLTVLRDGERVSSMAREEVTEKALITAITGKEKGLEFPKLNRKLGKKILEVKNLSSIKGLRSISFSLREGEILGIGGLMGSGKSDIGRSVFGLDKVIEGEITISGKKAGAFSPKSMINEGVVYFPADKHQALIGCRNLKENQTILALHQFIRRGIIQKKKEVVEALNQAKKTNIKPPNLAKIVAYFSGGNQKKILISRALLLDHVRIFILDEVTHGIDIGGKIELFRIVKELSTNGAAVIYISSEMDELLNLCHRVVVMHQFRVFRELSSTEATRDNLLHHFFGLE